MIRTAFVTLAIAASLLQAQAANDWSKACTDGKCAFDTPDTKDGGVPATMKVWGDVHAIKDITPAAGWKITGCNSKDSAQTIQITCTDPSKDCDHLDGGNGAVDTVARVPQGCSNGPFVRVVKISPASKTKRAGAQAPRTLSFDMNWDQAKNPPVVNFALVGGDTPVNIDDIPSKAVGRRGLREQIVRQQIARHYDAAFASAKGMSPRFEKGISKALPPLDFNKQFTIANQDLSCANGNVHLGVTAATTAHADLTVGLVVDGQIFPPKITSVAVTATFNMNLDAQAQFSASGQATILNTGNVDLATIGIPGFSIPGIFDLGPSLAVTGSATANVDADVEMNVDINYQINNAVFAFPPSAAHPAGGDPAPQDNPITLNASPSLNAHGTLEVHVGPKLQFGLSALGGRADATIFVGIDAVATLDLTLQGNAQGNLAVTPASAAAAVASLAKAEASKAAASKAKSTAPPAKGAVKAAPPAKAAPPTKAAAPAKAAPPAKNAPMSKAKVAAAPAKAPAKAPVAGKGHRRTEAEGAVTFLEREETEDLDLTNDDNETEAESFLETEGSDFENDSEDSEDSDALVKRVDKSGSASFNGCVNLSGGVTAEVGAQGDLFGLFNAVKQFTLFSKQFQIFNQCFGKSTRDLERFTPRSLPAPSLVARGLPLACPKTKSAPATNIVKTKVPKANIKVKGKREL